MIAELPEALRRAVSPYTGIVRAVDECLASTADPRLFQASCEVGDDEALLGVGLGHLSGIGGTGATRAEAGAAAVGEAVERYSASYVSRERLVVAAARDLPGAVAPERFALFSERQHRERAFPFRPFTSDTVTTWIEGVALPAGGPAWLPAELVFLAPAGVPGRPSIAYGTSSGLACGESVEDAVLRGLCEVLERDAFMIVWANRLALPLLVADAATLSAPFDRTGLEYAVIDLSAIHRFPIALGIVRAGEGLLGAVGVGAAAAPTAERAWWKALAEAFATRAAGAALTVLSEGKAVDEVVSFEDHIRRYAAPGHDTATQFIDASRDRTALRSVAPLEGGSPSERIEALCRRVEAAGSSAYAVDTTSPDVESLGLVVTRVVTPELCRLDVAHRARFLGGRRLYEEAARLGLRHDVLTESGINPDPHPFP